MNLSQNMKIFILITSFLILLIAGATLTLNEEILKYTDNFNVYTNNISEKIIVQEPKTISSCDEMKTIITETIKKNESFKTLRNLEIVESSTGKTVEEPDYYPTNVQVSGVDEADIVKTDGRYIYLTNQNSLYIIDADPNTQKQILSKILFDDSLSPDGLFIQNNKLIVFGIKNSTNFFDRSHLSGEKWVGTKIFPDVITQYSTNTFVKLFDIADKENPELIRDMEFNGSYKTARKTNSRVYLVINNTPLYQFTNNLEKIDSGQIDQLLPQYKDSKAINENTASKLLTQCNEIDYIEPVQDINFVSIIGISMLDETEKIETKTILGSGENIYASKNNIYLTNTVFDIVSRQQEKTPSRSPLILPYLPSEEKTNIYKFSIKNNEIEYETAGSIPGRAINQFSMDEHREYFRIATTTGHVSRSGETESENNLFIIDDELNITGFITNIAPGEKIYSARFIGDKGFLVTFKKVDPFFTFDLSDPKNPKIIGQLKIPGYSDYLHPYDENHIIGIGKNTVEANSNLTGNSDFAWHQGIKMAMFDITDFSHPKELYKIEIGDRGSDSPILYDHKALLFSKNRNLLVLPILETALTQDQKEKNTEGNLFGKPIYQGSYIFNVNPYTGFTLKGKITHQSEEDLNLNYIDHNNSIYRNIYINNLLYSISNNKILLNNLYDLSVSGEVDLNQEITTEAGN